jgi:acyl-coenzyme A synthetase/AMP-(fatty) acid ligase/alkanesulfonate monooxygenase SsuD/methylene tetrahydromethanopterin reductase-like flavin-dependent oxidoreductase (luciferase family)
MSGPAIGVRVPQYGSTWGGIRAFALRAEQRGFAGLWVNDHLQSPGRVKDEPAFDALVTLSALAAVTERPRLGVAVLSASYRPAPLAAKMATILDVVSGGRLVVGLGAGSDVPEHRAYGVPFGRPGERTEALRDALEVMRAMFEHPEGADVPGVLAGAPNQPPPIRPGGPPIWLAAHRPRLLRLAGERADGIVAAFAEPEEVGRRLAVAEEARLAAGRPPLACALYTFALPIPSEDEAHAWLSGEAAALGTSPPRLLRWLRGTGIVGSPDELRETLAAHGRAGVTDAVLVLPSRVPLEAVDALAEATLPAAPAAPAPRPGAVGRAEDNLVSLLVERHAEGGLADHPAAIDDEGRWSFADLSAASARAAGALAEAGVRRGDRVAVALRDGRPWLAAFLGAARLGAVPVPLDPAAGAERLAGVLDDCEPTVLVGAPEAAIPGVTRMDPGALDEGEPRPVRAVRPEDLGYLVYSSGSTGRPKGAMHAHQDLRAGIETYAREVLALTPEDRCHSIARLFTSLGFGNGFFRVIGSGSTAVLSAGTLPTPRSVLATVERQRVTVLTAVPTFWSQIARFLERHPDDGALASVRLAVSSGDSLPPSVGERLRAVTGIELIEGLGCSECSNIVISTRPGEPLPGTLGRAVEGVEIRLADDAGAPVAPGEPGRLWIRSPSNTTGYWRRVAETRELVYGPWLRMGDTMAEVDGVYRHLGRSDDLFKVDARWVSPVEVEGALLTHPAVAEAVVVGLPGPDGLTRPAAFVVLAPDAGDAGDDLAVELRRQVARALEPHKAPQSVTVLEALPRLPSGKLDRRRLREG